MFYGAHIHEKNCSYRFRILSIDVGVEIGIFLEKKRIFVNLSFLLIDIGKVYDLRCQFSIYSFLFLFVVSQMLRAFISKMKKRWDAFYCMPLRFNYGVKLTSSPFSNFMYCVEEEEGFKGAKGVTLGLN